MKLKHLFFAAAAAVLAFAACEQEEPIGVPDLQVTPSSVSFQAGASSQTVTLTATRDWTVSGAPEWLAFDPSSGKASDGSQTVTITAMANSGYNRSADVTFTIGLMKAYVHVDQTGDKGEFDSGDGSKERPFSATAAYEYTLSLPSDGEGGPFYIKGIVSSVSTTYEASGNYGNASFYLSDDGSTTGTQFYVYQTYYLGNRKWKSGDKEVKAGDEVIVYGKVVNYKGNTPETVGKGSSYVYSLNGETGDSTPQTEITASTVADFISKADGSTYYRLTGKVSAFKTGTNSSGKNWMQFNLTDETGTILVYGFNDGEYDKWAGTIKDGGTATLTGTYEYYEQKKQHEVMNTTIESFEAGDTPPGPSGEAKGTGTKDDPYNSVAAANAVKNLTWTNTDSYETTSEVYVKGKISRIASKGTFGESGTYGNASFYISEDGTQTDEFYCFRILYLGNAKYTSGTDIKVGDEVIVCGQLMNYHNDTPETVAGKAYLYSLNGQTSGGGDTPPGPSGDVKAVTVSDFLAAAESETQVYELVGTIGGSINTTYGNFDLTDDSGTVYVYGLTATNLGYGAKNDKSYASLGLNEGDKIKIRGYRGSFTDKNTGEKKDEVVYAWFIEKVSDGGGGQGGDTGDVKAVTVSEFLAAAESETQVYELVGTIGGSINTTYGNFDLTDDSGTVYVYGLTATNLGYGAKNDKSYASLGLNEGDKIKIRGYRGSFTDKNTGEKKDEVVYAWFIEKVSDGGGGGQGGGGEETGDFTSNVSWTSGTDSSYDEKATVNGTANVAVLKLGTGSKTGSSTLTLPEGSTSLTFYALSWKDKPSKAVFKVNGTEVASVEPAANSGLSNKEPYTLTVTASDKYTITFSATSTLTVETSGSNTRVALFGVQAK